MTNVVLLDALPANVTYVGANPAPTSINEGQLRWDLGTLAGNTNHTPLRVQVHIPDTAVHGETITNTVQVYGDQAELDLANNGFVHIVEVREDVDLAVDKSGVGEPAVGEHYRYFIDYANWGGAPASGAVITDLLPSQVSLISADPPPTGQSGGVLTWTLPTLPGNQWGDRIRLMVDILNPGDVTNQAQVGSPAAETTLANNADSHTEQVDDILAPVILRPTRGTTDETPTFSGLAPSGSVVELWDLSQSPAASLGVTTTATAEGTFSIELSLPNGSYTVAAIAAKSGLTSDYSNAVSIVVSDDLALDPDFLTISSEGVDVSAGSVHAERNLLPYSLLDVSAQLTCPSQPSAHLRVVENGLWTHETPPYSLTDLGGGEWEVDVRTFLGERHSAYEIFLEWDCEANSESVLLLYVLIDPDGFLFDQSLVDSGAQMGDALITTGVITAYVRVGDDWQLWNAGLYGQTNPQLTDGATDDGVLTAGYYSFLTPSGQYLIEAAAPGYQPFMSDVITVITTPVRLDIGLQPVMGGIGQVQLMPNLSTSSKTVDLADARLGDVLTYDLWLHNTGGEDSQVLQIIDDIPDKTVFVDNSLTWDSGSASYDAGLERVAWQGAIPSGGSVHIQYQVRVLMVYGAPFTVVNTAQASGASEVIETLPALTASTQVTGEYQFLPLVYRR
jgi:uncharacterized repeat protein (TIGR01451 family)